MYLKKDGYWSLEWRNRHFHYNALYHMTSLNTMLEKTSVSMMVLLLASSLIGISSIYQYVEGQTPKPQQTVQVAGRVVAAIISASKTCTAFVELPGDKPNLLGLKPGTTITLIAPIESCALFGLSKIGKTQIQFVTQTAPSSTLEYRVTQVIL